MPTDGEGLPANVNAGHMDSNLYQTSQAGRREERRKIVAYLRGLASDPARLSAAAASSFHNAADRIERGEHE